MLIKAIEVGYLQTNCYIVADEATLDAAVIDPGADSNLILDYIERCHFHVRAILRDLPGDYEVYPGHEGSTSLEYERRFNPYMLRPWDL